MAVPGVLKMSVEVLDEGTYSVLYEDWTPLPLVILVGAGKMSCVWPQKEVVLRFRFAS